MAIAIRGDAADVPRASAVLNAVAALDFLPVLRTVRARTRNLLVRGGPALDAVADEAASDLGLAARVFSAASRQGLACEGLHEAVTALGPQRVGDVLADTEVFDLLEPAGRWGWQLHRERTHALGVRALALETARLLGLPGHDRIAAAALLHDIGRLAIALTGRLSETSASAGERVRVERHELGFDHAAVGGIVARRWRLPEALTRPISRHHSAVDGVAGVVRFADTLWHHVHTSPAPMGVAVVAEQIGVSLTDAARLLETIGRRAAARPAARTESPLSPRQHEIIRLLSQGKTYKQIAGELNLSTSTLRSHLSHAYRKLGVTDRAQAVLLATRRGWI